MHRTFFSLALCLLMTSCQLPQDGRTPPTEPEVEIPPTAKLATFAGGCFWCMESPFEKLDGVYEVLSGFAGGEEKNPSYKEVARGLTGHREVVQVYYDPKKVNYDQLLDVYWMQVDPTDEGGQFVDRGFQYSTAIYYHDDEQQRLAEASKAELDASGRYDNAIVTPILPYDEFYIAEDYHQDYYKKNPIRYKYYYNGSGRGQFLDEVWEDER